MHSWCLNKALCYFYKLAPKLEDLLVGIGVNYFYKKFDSDKGIQNLSQPVFVSIILYQLHSLCELYLRQCNVCITCGWMGCMNMLSSSFQTM